MSPFCVKLECYLRVAEIPYELEAANMMKAPRGKVPYVDVDGTVLGDSQLIIEHLDRLRGKSLEDGLSAKDRAVAHTVRRMLEEGTYFSGMWLRWGTDEPFAHVAAEFRNFLPGPTRLLLPLIKGKVRKMLVGQGIGRHRPEDIVAFAKSDLSSVSEILGDKPFLFGDTPSTADCTLYGFLCASAGFPHESELRAFARTDQRLVSFRERVEKRWWKDLAPLA